MICKLNNTQRKSMDTTYCCTEITQKLTIKLVSWGDIVNNRMACLKYILLNYFFF